MNLNEQVIAWIDIIAMVLCIFMLCVAMVLLLIIYIQTATCMTITVSPSHVLSHYEGIF